MLDEDSLKQQGDIDSSSEDENSDVDTYYIVYLKENEKIENRMNGSYVHHQAERKPANIIYCYTYKV